MTRPARRLVPCTIRFQAPKAGVHLLHLLPPRQHVVSNGSSLCTVSAIRARILASRSRNDSTGFSSGQIVTRSNSIGDGSGATALSLTQAAITSAQATVANSSRVFMTDSPSSKGGWKTPCTGQGRGWMHDPQPLAGSDPSPDTFFQTVLTRRRTPFDRVGKASPMFGARLAFLASASRDIHVFLVVEIVPAPARVLRPRPRSRRQPKHLAAPRFPWWSHRAPAPAGGAGTWTRWGG